jgi:hypothetical protein
VSDLIFVVRVGTELSVTDRSFTDEAMKEITLPPLIDEPKILEDVEHTWTVENWRNLGKREHGPVFHAHGYPWCVHLLPFKAVACD